MDPDAPQPDDLQTDAPPSSDPAPADDAPAPAPEPRSASAEPAPQPIETPTVPTTAPSSPESGDAGDDDSQAVKFSASVASPDMNAPTPDLDQTSCNPPSSDSPAVDWPAPQAPAPITPAAAVPTDPAPAFDPSAPDSNQSNAVLAADQPATKPPHLFDGATLGRLGLAARQRNKQARLERLLAHAAAKGHVNVIDVRLLLDIPQRTAEEYLDELVAAGNLSRRGQKSKTEYWFVR